MPCSLQNATTSRCCRGVQLNLIDGRPCAGLLVQTLQIGGHEVAYAERAGHAFVAQLDRNAFQVSVLRQSNGVGQWIMYMST